MNSKIKKMLIIASCIVIGISLVGCKSSKTNSKEVKNNISVKTQDNGNKDVKLSKEELANNKKASNNEKYINTKINDKKTTNVKEQKKEVSLSNNKSLVKKAKVDTNTDTITNKPKDKVYNIAKKKNKSKIKHKPSNNINIKNNSIKVNKTDVNLDKNPDKKVQAIKEAKEVKAKSDNNFVYSSMSDSLTQKEIAQVLKNAGVKKENVDRFINYINNYDSVVGKLNTSTTGFKAVNPNSVDYEEISDYIMDKWYKHSMDPADINCRLTAFSLFKDNIISEGKSEDVDSWLVFDLDAIRRYELCNFKKEEVEKFLNTYAAIPTVQTKDVKKHADIIKKEWKKRKVSFVKNSSISLINGFLHFADRDLVFSGHSGVLLKDNKGFIFIEKYSFFMPYQAIRFNNKAEVKKYLLDRLDVEYGQESSKPIIMENDKLM